MAKFKLGRVPARFIAVVLGLSSVCVGAGQAHADFVLKPKGAPTLQLRRTGLKVDATLRGGVAEVRQEMTFLNEAQRRMEADFIMTVPDSAIVTGFAYWYKQEKVVAHIVEKERAAEIYRTITSYQRDPALVEMIGKNTFRARIFPIEPNADLRVEVRTVEALASTREGRSWKLELKPKEAGTGTLDNLDVQVHIPPDKKITKVMNNYALPIATGDTEQSLKFSRSNYRPNQDLKVTLGQVPHALDASVLAARSGGQDGFFTFVVSTRENLMQPHIAVKGVPVYALNIPVAHRLHAFDNWVISGRYRGEGKALVVLTGRNAQGRTKRWTAQAVFTSWREDNSAATKFWAWQRLAQLGANEKRRAEILQLSTRFTLPSAFTSWLAIPEEERQRYGLRKSDMELARIAQRLVDEIAAGRGKGQKAQQLRERLGETAQVGYENDYIWRVREAEANAIADLMTREMSTVGDSVRTRRLWGRLQVLDGSTSMKVDSRLSSQADRLLYNIASTYTELKYRPGTKKQELKNLKDKMSRLSGLSSQNLQSVLSSSERDVADSHHSLLAEELIDEVINGRGRTHKAKRLQREMQVLAKRGGFRTDEQMGWPLQRRYEELMTQAQRARYAMHPDTHAVEKFEAQAKRLSEFFPQTDDTYNRINNGRMSWIITENLRLARQDYLIKLWTGGPHASGLDAMEEYITRLYTDPNYYAPIYWDYYQFTEAQRALPRDKPPLQHPNYVKVRQAYDVAYEEQQQWMKTHDGQPNPGLQQNLESAYHRLSYATRYHLRLGDPLISIDAPRDAQSVVAVMPDGGVKRLLWNETNQKWEARFDVPATAAEGNYVISIVVVTKDGSRSRQELRYKVDMSAPNGQAQVQLVEEDAAGPCLRLELEASEGTTRATATLPWQERVDLKASPTREHVFFAVVPLTDAQYLQWKSADADHTITFVLTDKAHNRSTVNVGEKPSAVLVSNTTPTN